MTKIKNIVKYGIPIIVLLLILFIYFFVSNNGDAEFGAIGNADSMIILLIAFIFLYLIAGIIVWAIKKANFIFLSALYSALVILAFILTVSGIKEFKKQLASEQYRKKELTKQQKNKSLTDSLNIVIKNNPENYIAIEKRALLYFNKDVVRKPATEEFKKHIDDLLLVISQNAASFESYEEVSKYYVFMKEHGKATKLWQDLKINISKNKTEFDENDIKKIEENINLVKEAKKQYLLQLKADKKWLIKQKKIKQELIDTLTEKFKKEGYNTEDLAQRGLAYKFLEMYEKALADFNHAIKLDKENRTAWVQRAAVLNDLKRYTEAIAAYKDLINKYPDTEELHKMKIAEIEIKQKAPNIKP